MVDVLDRMLEAVAPGGAVLDLQVIRPAPAVEAGGERVCELDGGELLSWADAATAAVDARIAAGGLRGEAVDDHDVRKVYADGPMLAARLAGSGMQRLRPPDVPRVRALPGPVDVRERCRLRRLRVL